MKKVVIKTEDAQKAYIVLNTAKYSKMGDGDKIKVWKAARALKSIALTFDDDCKDAAEKMKPTDNFDERLVKAQQYQNELRKGSDANMAKIDMTAEDFQKFADEFNAYNRLVSDAVRDFAQKEVEVEIDALSDEAFGLLMASNDWNMEQAMAVGDILCE